MLIELPDLMATEALGRRLAGLLRAGDAVLLDGPLGAGKTALARALLREACGDPGLDVPSPSYTLVQAYDGPGFPIHHFDLWRLGGEAEVVELGWDEARVGAVIVEWPDRLGSLRPFDALEVGLAPASADAAARRAVLRGWEGRLPASTDAE